MAKRATVYFNRYLQRTVTSLKNSISVTISKMDMDASLGDWATGEDIELTRIAKMERMAARAEKKDRQAKLYAKERYWRKHDESSGQLTFD